MSVRVFRFRMRGPRLTDERDKAHADIELLDGTQEEAGRDEATQEDARGAGADRDGSIL